MPPLRHSTPIVKKRVDTFEELRDLLENQVPHIDQFVFRGQSDATWELQSTLHRLILRARVANVRRGSVETFVKRHLERFRQEIRGRRGDNPSKLEEDPLWALGQHFGLATPLLDWSHSPYISVFFALEALKDESSETDRALWCLNRNEVERTNEGLADQMKLKLLFPDTDDNRRLLGQSGLFSKGPVMMSVDKWVEEKCQRVAAPALIKIAFPGDKEFRMKALQKLNLMNLNHSTLFPDLTGASRHSNVIAEGYEV